MANQSLIKSSRIGWRHIKILKIFCVSEKNTSCLFVCEIWIIHKFLPFFCFFIGRAWDLKSTDQNSSIAIKENDRYIDCCGRILHIPMDWLYANSSRIQNNKKIILKIIRNNIKDVPFIIKEKQYRIINDEVVEVMYKIITHWFV